MSEHVARTWGSTEAEREMQFGCEAYLDDPAAVYFRGIDIDAPAPVVFRWLCQLRAAPYSYDWLDNFGRRSPRQLTPGLEDLKLGDRFMTIFDLVSFEADRQITLAVGHFERIFGPAAVTYLVVPGQEEEASRLWSSFCWADRAGPDH